jgi:ABC-type transporter MlaC component
MTDWLLMQFTELNVLAIVIIFVFVTFTSKANTQKLLKEQSQELYNELEEVKDEIRGNAKK